VRPYKPRFSSEKSVAMILEGSGTQFDPHIVQAFVEILDEINLAVEHLQEKPELGLAA